jgi:hypothetical protein
VDFVLRYHFDMDEEQKSLILSRLIEESQERH